MNALEAISTFVSAIIATIAVGISVATLKQNNKMIYEANKPNIQLFVDTIMVEHFQKVLIIKNFGQTSAIIKSISFSKKLDDVNEKTRLATMSNATLSPNQSFMTRFSDDYTEKLEATISYVSDMDKHKHFKTFSLDFSQTDDLRWVKETNPELSQEAKATINAALGVIRTLK